MSTRVDFYIEISKCRIDRQEEIEKSLKGQFEYKFSVGVTADNGTDGNHQHMDIRAEGTFSGDSEEIAEELTKDIWLANGEYCNIKIEMCFLDYCPKDNYEGDPDAYNRFVQENKA